MRKYSRTLTKTLVIAEIIALYMSVLVVISYARGPVRYEANTDAPICVTEDFISFSGAQGNQGGALPFENNQPGEAVGWQKEIAIYDLDRIHVSFKLNCPAEYAGGTLFVDLYNFENSYDSPNQEYQLVLTQGENTADFTLLPGESKPEKANIRFFTLNPALYSVENLNICEEKQCQKVSTAQFVGVGISALLLAVTVTTREIQNWRTRREDK